MTNFIPTNPARGTFGERCKLAENLNCRTGDMQQLSCDKILTKWPIRVSDNTTKEITLFFEESKFFQYIAAR